LSMGVTCATLHNGAQQKPTASLNLGYPPMRLLGRVGQLTGSMDAQEFSVGRVSGYGQRAKSRVRRGMTTYVISSTWLSQTSSPA
jgi:hypothetical protein